MQIPLMDSENLAPELVRGASKNFPPSRLDKKLGATEVFNTYWLFAAERQEIFFRRLVGEQKPWTADGVLQKHKFTNAYRASDRVSQYLIRNVIYNGSEQEVEVFFRILLFKLFNKIETWELLESELGHISFKDYSFSRYDEVLTRAMNNANRIYSAAYIMPSGGSFSNHKKKHRMHLDLLEYMIRDSAHEKIVSARSMSEGFNILKSYPTIGNFLAYQFIIDINYSHLTNFSENDFVVAGPGAISGIGKCFTNPNKYSESEIIKMVRDEQEREFERLGLRFKSLWGRPLMLIDCQNLFCETDKYSRVAHPNAQGGSNRTRIKQIFNPTTTPIGYYYPPKWGINHKIYTEGYDV
ncbi:MAG: nucleotide kinase domain-containing protein [Pseudodesulfovibrio sp.]|uniref:nucleotide kinase domain-containing protein n=1 Tax=Pseudodesulfovibrio sp. TaxID=2035812 RepID=UPI003D113A7E